MNDELWDAVRELTTAHNNVARALQAQITAQAQRITELEARVSSLAAADTMEDGETVAASLACPKCHENREDWLVWDSAEMLNCAACGTRYDPNA